jgi:hypothetical protein
LFGIKIATKGIEIISNNEIYKIPKLSPPREHEGIFASSAFL